MYIGDRMMSETGIVVQCEGSEKARAASCKQRHSQKVYDYNPLRESGEEEEVNTQGGKHFYHNNLSLNDKFDIF